MDVETCPVCGSNLLPVFGRPKSPLLIVGGEPQEEEFKTGRAYSNKMGHLLKDEMSLAGLSFQYCRATYLWLHPVPKGNDKSHREIKKRCYDYCFTRLIQEMSTAEVVFLLGADVVKVITGHPVSKVAGVPSHSVYVDPKIVIIAGYSPGLALSPDGVIGDVRFTIQQFAKYAKPILKERMSK